MRIYKLEFALALLILCAMASSASAELLVYEPFAYDEGWLSTDVFGALGGALGTTGTWTAWDTLNADWFVHQEGDTAGIVVDPGPPVVRNMFDGTVANLPTTGGYAGLPGPDDVGRGPDEDFEIGRYMNASIAIDPSVTATFTAGTTTWFSFVTARGWDRNERTPHLIIGTDTTPNGDRGLTLINSGSGIGAGGGPPRNNRTDIFPQYFSEGLMNNAFGESDGAGFNSIPELPDDTHTLPWDEFDDDGNFGPPIIVVGKIEWDADTGGEDIISVVRFLETDTLSEAEFDTVIFLTPGLSSADWDGNKPDLDQSQFDTIDLSGTKVFVDEIRLGTTFDDVIGNSSPPQLPGDINSDGVVNEADFRSFVQHYGTPIDGTFETGDFNSDGKTGIADLAILQNNFGAGTPAAVPEPSSIILMLLAMVFGGFTYRRRFRS